MASEEFTTAMAALDGNTRALIQGELDRLTQLGNEQDRTANEQSQGRQNPKNVIKKPATYEVGEDIKAYVNSWEIYKKLLNLSDNVACLSFTTYLNPVTQNRLKVLGLLEEKNWGIFAKEVIKALATPKSKYGLRHQLRNMKQQPNESLVDFSGKLLQLAGEAFGDNEETEKDDALKTALCAGIECDSIAVKIIENDAWDFTKALDYAVRKETSLSARKSMQKLQVREEVAILAVNQEENEESASPASGDSTLEELKGDQTAFHSF